VGALTVLALLAALQAAVQGGAVNAAIVPPPSMIARKLWAILAAGAFLQPLGQTLRLLAIGYGIGCMLGSALGLAMGRFAAVHDLLEPLVEIVRPLPKPALLPPLILFLGLGDAMKLSVIALGVFFPVLINTVQGVRGTEPVLVDTARTFGHGRIAQLFKVTLPSALPMIFAGMRVSLGLGLVLVVIAEMLAGTGGVGFLIIDMQRSFRIPDMYAWIVILAVLGFALNLVFLRLERRAIHWSYESGK
jgi:ABC-type nitrate/sulfonate/bicarbonate transport system permease component